MPSERCMAGLGLLRVMVRHYAKDGDASPNLPATLAEYETMLVGGRYDARLADRFRREMVDYLASQDTMLSKSWTQYVDVTAVLPDKRPWPMWARRNTPREHSLRKTGAGPPAGNKCASLRSVADSAGGRRRSLSAGADG